MLEPKIQFLGFMLINVVTHHDYLHIRFWVTDLPCIVGYQEWLVVNHTDTHWVTDSPQDTISVTLIREAGGGHTGIWCDTSTHRGLYQFWTSTRIRYQFWPIQKQARAELNQAQHSLNFDLAKNYLVLLKAVCVGRCPDLKKQSTWRKHVFKHCNECVFKCIVNMHSNIVWNVPPPSHRIWKINCSVPKL